MAIKKGVKKGRKAEQSKKASSSDLDFTEDPEALKDKIRYLEEELLRKQQLVEKLKEENTLLFKTALKSSHERVKST